MIYFNSLCNQILTDIFEISECGKTHEKKTHLTKNV